MGPGEIELAPVSEDEISMGWRSLYPLCGASALIPMLSWVVVPVGQVASTTVAAVSAEGGESPERVGSMSCSGRGCHGKVAPRGTEGSEYNTWANLDPHRNAFLALFDCRSESIRRNLGRELPPSEDPLCLSCHGQADSPEAVRSLGTIDCESSGSISLMIGPSGVGCEDCHGAAGPWIDLHYREGWPERFPEAASTMRSLAPTVDRASVCLRCHVGSGLAQEVNHDLIAAGHPRLNFELVSFSDRMPRHWDQEATEDERRGLGLPERDPAGEWAIGQVASLRSTLDVLAARSDETAEGPADPPWPEFSEYACYSCHHALVDGGLHYSRGNGVPGSFSWGTWILPMSRALADRANPELVGPMDAIALLMREPWPDRDRVAEGASRLSDDLGRWLSTFDESAFGRSELRSMLATIAADRQRFGEITSNWDGAAQLYLACRALLRSEAEGRSRSGGLRNAGDDPLRRQFDALRAVSASLAFPEVDLDSPGSRGEPAPGTEPPGPIVEAMKELFEELELDPGGKTGPDSPASSD
jgi:hypothetical protein